MSNLRFLIIEDDEPKQRSILQFLRECLPEASEILVAESLASAIQILSSQDICFAVVDMSIPTFDFAKDRRGGGQPQGFGGADILRFIESETTKTKTVVLTQYEEFVLPIDGSRRDPQGLESMLRSELDERFLGVIHYGEQYGVWRQKLRDILIGADLVSN